jgi:hypothetical protein
LTASLPSRMTPCLSAMLRILSEKYLGRKISSKFFSRRRSDDAIPWHLGFAALPGVASPPAALD